MGDGLMDGWMHGWMDGWIISLKGWRLHFHAPFGNLDEILLEKIPSLGAYNLLALIYISLLLIELFQDLHHEQAWILNLKKYASIPRSGLERQLTTSEKQFSSGKASYKL